MESVYAVPVAIVNSILEYMYVESVQTVPPVVVDSIYMSLESHV